MRHTRFLPLAAAFVFAAPASATWSIVLADAETNEVAVGTVTCLTNFNLLAIVPVVVVEQGAGACQASGDFDGIRRPIMFDGLMNDQTPPQILNEVAMIAGHQSRQYGIVDTDGRRITFTGTSALAWAGGVTGQDGTMVYAIQGNILTGACVVAEIENAILGTPGDMPAKLMAGMEAARDAGGDGRCSCPGSPTGCGCPPPNFTKSGHIGGMIVARPGDTDDPVCNSGGCADGSYVMRFNVAFQSSGAPDPVDQLRGQYDTWRAGLIGRPDAGISTIALAASALPPNGTSTTVMTVTARDWQGTPVPVNDLTVAHHPESAGSTTIGVPQDQGGGVWTVPLTSGTTVGVDRLRVVVDDGVRLVTIMPDALLEYDALGDLNGDGAIAFADLLALLSAWGPCAGAPAACLADLDGNGAVTFADLLILLASWSG